MDEEEDGDITEDEEVIPVMVENRPVYTSMLFYFYTLTIYI